MTSDGMEQAEVVLNRHQRRAQGAKQRQTKRLLTKKFEAQARKMHEQAKALQAIAPSEAAKEYSFG